jgi:7,8-dihydroneopterin aldolase/epimerase/oxygenase
MPLSERVENVDKISVNQMVFYGYHGVFPEETRLGQRFIVDIDAFCSLRQAGITDDLSFSVSYADIYSICKDVVEGEPFKLIEAVAERIASLVLERYPVIMEVRVKLIKPDPPIPGHYQSVSIEIIRSR